MGTNYAKIEMYNFHQTFILYSLEEKYAQIT